MSKFFRKALVLVIFDDVLRNAAAFVSAPEIIGRDRLVLQAAPVPKDFLLQLYERKKYEVSELEVWFHLIAVFILLSKITKLRNYTPTPWILYVCAWGKFFKIFNLMLCIYNSVAIMEERNI